MALCGFAQRPLRVSKGVSLWYLLSGTKQAKRTVRGHARKVLRDTKGQGRRAVYALARGFWLT